VRTAAAAAAVLCMPAGLSCPPVVHNNKRHTTVAPQLDVQGRAEKVSPQTTRHCFHLVFSLFFRLSIVLAKHTWQGTPHSPFVPCSQVQP
jgi:hypothetical protein